MLNWLFDFSFKNFVTLTLMKFLYGLSLFISFIIAIFFIVAGFGISVGIGVLFLILSPIVFILLAFVSRVYLELIAVIFRIEQNTAKITKADN
jgi:hypothetical protein